MKFAFLVHPISAESGALLDLDAEGTLRNAWGIDPLRVCASLHQAVSESRGRQDRDLPLQARVIDELKGMTSIQGATAEGRLYEIPMDAMSILEDPDRALGYMEQALDMAVEWGARIVGLGSMTGIVGGRGTHLAERSPIAITTGNSMTVYAALQNVYHIVSELDIDLKQETVAVVGVPGSIASAVAALLAPQCGNLILVGRQPSVPARKLAEQVGGRLCLDVREALAEARVVISATSTGNCIDQSWLLPGSVVIDVGVPTDVQGNEAQRSDILVLTGGLARMPQTVPLQSKILWFQHGMVPSCFGETMVLALENREESLSLGRTLDLDSIQEIGGLARSHGFDFSRLYSFGYALSDSALVQFRKARERLRRRTPRSKSPAPSDLAERAAVRHSRHINPVLMAMGGPTNFVKTFVRGEGPYLFDDEGRRYLDFVAGFGSVNMGHNHPVVVSAVNEALLSQAPGFAQAAVNPYAAALAERLAAVAPSGLEMVFFANSGTEAVEASLKLARAATGREGLLYCERAYHGKTFGALSLAGNAEYRRPFAPLMPGCDAVPFGDIEALERALVTKRYAGFIVEPIQSEGGINVPPAGYLRLAQSLCQQTGTLLIADEVQTGLGRTGSMFAVDREGVAPDLMALAKSLGGGLIPIGAMLARRDLWLKAYGTVQTFALHTSTFGGGSLACAAALAALDVIRDDNLVSNAQERGEQLSQGLGALCQRHPCLRQSRGRGLLQGLEFMPLAANINAHWKASDPTGMTRFLVPNLDKMVEGFHVVHAMQTLLNGHGIYTQVARSNPLVLRIQPPLTINRDQIDEFLSALDQTCEEIDYSTSLIDGMIAKSSVGKHNAHLRNQTDGNGQPQVQNGQPQVQR